MNRVEEIRAQLLKALPNLDIFGEGAGWELAVTTNGPKPEHAERTRADGTSYSIPEHEVYWVVTRMKDAQLKGQLTIVNTAYSRLYRDEITLSWYGGASERQRQTAQLVADMPTHLLYLLERIQALELERDVALERVRVLEGGM